MTEPTDLYVDLEQKTPSEMLDEIVRLRAALTQFVAACDTAPPTSLMVEIGMACNVARAALQRS